MEQTMHAVGFRSYGSVEVLEALKIERPLLTPQSVMVRVVAAGVNPADWVIRSGQLRFFARLKFPFICGYDIAGIVTEIGPAVTRFKPGDAVYAMLPNVAGGAYAEHVAVKEEMLVAVPDSLTFAEAAAVPLTSLTALQGLRDHARVQPGARVFINGASGGVGSFAVQIANVLQAEVTAACSDRNVEFVRSLGADRVVDYTHEPLSVAGEASYDSLFDTVGVLSYRQAAQLVRPGGSIVTLNPQRANPLQILLSSLNPRRKRLKTFFVRSNGADLRLISEWIEAGKVRPMVERVFPLGEAADAQRLSESKRVRGKLVLAVDEQLTHTRASNLPGKNPSKQEYKV